MFRCRRWVALVTVGAASCGWTPAAAVSPDWAARWRSDLLFAADTLPQVHPNLFHAVARERFLAEIDSLAARVPQLEHHQITVELARIVALVGDGHTRLTLPFDPAAGFFTGHSKTEPPLVPGLVFHHLPVRLRSFSDGMYVVRASHAHRDLLGAKVLELGSLPIAAAIAAIEPAVQRDNDSQLRDLLAQFLVVPEVLHARGVIPDAGKVRIVVESGGRKRSAALAPVPLGSEVAWLEARTPGSPLRSERHPESRHWFERIEGTKTIYACYREVQDDEGESVADFASGLFREVESGAADRLILDVRGNVGGNGFLNRPLVQGIIAARELWRPAHLFVLADRGTFSAAMMLVAALEKDTPAVIVGEKTGGRPNGYGDSRRVRLPATGLTIRVSSLYWQLSDPRDPRDGITPHVAAEPSFEDWRQRRDPALETAVAMAGAAGEAAGAWEGEVAIAHQRLPITLRVAPEGAAWKASVDFAAIEARDEPVHDVAFTDGELAFTRRGEGPAWEFRGRVTARWITGIVRYQGSTLPFVLHRSEAKPKS